MTLTEPWQIRRVDYRSPTDSAALVQLLNMYALDPMGGGEPLADGVKAGLCHDLADMPNAVSFIAWRGVTPVGLINCFIAYSTFKAKPLLNVHDIAVDPKHRGKGIAHALLAAAQTEAIQRGCCKMTLEVLSGNTRATATYEHFGFASYQLDPAAGHADAKVAVA